MLTSDARFLGSPMPWPWLLLACSNVAGQLVCLLDFFHSSFPIVATRDFEPDAALLRFGQRLHVLDFES